MSPTQDTGGVRIYPARRNIGLQAAGFLAGGIVYMLMLVVMFLLALFARQPRPNSIMPGLIGGLSVVGIGLIARGIFLLKSVRRVMLDDQAIHREGFASRSSVAWTQIDHLERARQSGWFGATSHDVLILMGAGNL